VYQFVEMFFRGEKIQKYAFHWATLIKRLLLGHDPEHELRETARKDNVDVEFLLDLPDDEVVGVVYNTTSGIEHCFPGVM